MTTCNTIKTQSNSNLDKKTNSLVQLEYVNPEYFEDDIESSSGIQIMSKSIDSIVVSPIQSMDYKEFEKITQDVISELFENESVKNSTSYPNLTSTVNDPTSGGSNSISPYDMNDFIVEYSYTIESLQAQTKKDPLTVASNLESFYSDNAISESVSSICSFLSMPFGVVSLAEELSQLVLDAVTKGRAYIGQAEIFLQNIFMQIDKLAESTSSIADNLSSNLSTTFEELGVENGSTYQAIISILTNKILDTKTFFEPQNMEKYKTKIENQLAKLWEGHSEVTLEIAEHILYLFCGITADIEFQIESQIRNLQDISTRAQLAYSELKALSDTNVKKSVESGRVSISEESRREQIEQWSNNLINSTNPSIGATPSPYVAKYTSHPEPDQWSNLKFTDKVIDNSFFTSNHKIHMYDYYPEITDFEIFDIEKANMSPLEQYYGCKLSVLEKANQVGQEYGVRFLVNSAYRPPVYNQWLRNGYSETRNDTRKNTSMLRGVAFSSAHMHGNALDIYVSASNLTVSDMVPLRTLFRAKGFGGFAHYTSGGFFHVDVGPLRDSWTGSPPN